MPPGDDDGTKLAGPHIRASGRFTRQNAATDCCHSLLTPEANDEDDSSEEKIQALAEIICRAGDECAAALFVLIGILENSTHPKRLANVAKHFAFTLCGKSNLYGIVDAQIAVVEGELLVGTVTA